jgi:hypothetical protein
MSLRRVPRTRFRFAEPLCIEDLNVKWRCLSGRNVKQLCVGFRVYILTGLALVKIERDFFVDNLMVRIHFIIQMILVERPRGMGV